ncbi:hypothetical protein [Aquirufa nivalisilvae]|uniref:hypothetical protein n=1 Tax=Aquirufa nivalisilvae TaxID=2516557 RepID=UPI001032A773|nr:hypothetical protein [Aquirufa nivalisilvae]TBH73389.1 hypothetical protein EWU22_06835 [Aquirufa nivalisilvae]
MNPKTSLLQKKLAFALIISFLIISNACQTTSDKQEANQSNLESKKQAKQKAWDESTPLLQRITLGSEGIIRNVTWGQDMSTIGEKVELSETQPSVGKSYTQFFDDTDLNFVDITYLPDENNKVKGIILNIFLEEQDDVLDLTANFKEYLGNIYGNGRGSAKKIVWKNENTQVILEDVGTPKDPGIQVVFSKIN